MEQEALIRHVWAEVILDVSHTPAGQLVLGQVKAEAAQLENCGLGFRSLRERRTENICDKIVLFGGRNGFKSSDQ